MSRDDWSHFYRELEFVARLQIVVTKVEVSYCSICIDSINDVTSALEVDSAVRNIQVTQSQAVRDESRYVPAWGMSQHATSNI